MYLKCQYLSEINDGRGIVFATGTPISNTMCEMYVMQKYLQESTLKRMELDYFDAWAATFGEVTTALELNVEGSGFRYKSRFNKFVNLPELLNTYWYTKMVITRIFIEDCFVINNVSLIQGKDNLFVAMPSYKTKKVDVNNRTIYQDVCYPVTKEFREKLYGSILETHEMEREKRLREASGKSENQPDKKQEPRSKKSKSK